MVTGGEGGRVLHHLEYGNYTLPHNRIYTLSHKKIIPLDKQCVTIYVFERLSLIMQLDQLSWMILNPFALQAG